jgi:hypothetical protein
MIISDYFVLLLLFTRALGGYADFSEFLREPASFFFQTLFFHHVLEQLFEDI